MTIDNNDIKLYNPYNISLKRIIEKVSTELNIQKVCIEITNIRIKLQNTLKKLDEEIALVTNIRLEGQFRAQDGIVQLTTEQLTSNIKELYDIEAGEQEIIKKLDNLYKFESIEKFHYEKEMQQGSQKFTTELTLKVAKLLEHDQQSFTESIIPKISKLKKEINAEKIQVMKLRGLRRKNIFIDNLYSLFLDEKIEIENFLNIENPPFMTYLAILSEQADSIKDAINNIDQFNDIITKEVNSINEDSINQFNDIIIKEVNSINKEEKRIANKNINSVTTLKAVLTTIYLKLCQLFQFLRKYIFQLIKFIERIFPQTKAEAEKNEIKMKILQNKTLLNEIEGENISVKILNVFKEELKDSNSKKAYHVERLSQAHDDRKKMLGEKISIEHQLSKEIQPIVYYKQYKPQINSMAVNQEIKVMENKLKLIKTRIDYELLQKTNDQIKKIEDMKEENHLQLNGEVLGKRAR